MLRIGRGVMQRKCARRPRAGHRRYSGRRSLISASSGAAASFSDSCGATIGQAMASCGSFQRTAISCAGFHSAVHLYSTSAGALGDAEAVQEAGRHPELVAALGRQGRRRPSGRNAASRGGCRRRRRRSRRARSAPACRAARRAARAGRAAMPRRRARVVVLHERQRDARPRGTCRRGRSRGRSRARRRCTSGSITQHPGQLGRDAPASAQPCSSTRSRYWP